MKTSIDKTYFDIFYLISAALNNFNVDEDIIRQIDFNNLYLLCKKHSLIALVSWALEKSTFFKSQDMRIQKAFLSVRDATIHKTILFNNERLEMLNELEKIGCYYVPLKGINIINYYPCLGMREFADNDILFDPKLKKEVKRIFLSRGYQIKTYNKSHHDVYIKKPIFNFEMHRYLFDKDKTNKFAIYFKDVFLRTIKDDNSNFGYHFSDNDDYLYNLAHAYKHYYKSGNGLRYLVDIYVYNKFKGQALDQSYLSNKFNKLEIADFEMQSKALAFKLFDKHQYKKEFSEEELSMLLYILDSETYGQLKNQINKYINQHKGHKLSYVLHRIYPGFDYLKHYHPFYAYTIVFIPLFIILRVLSAFTWKRHQAHKEMSYVNKYKK